MEGSLGVDATVIASFARGTRSKGPHAATDPDAGWYVRDGDHADPDQLNPAGNAVPVRTSRKKKLVYGYDATLAVARNPHKRDTPQARVGDPTNIPALAMGVRLDKPGHNPGGNAIAILSDILRRGTNLAMSPPTPYTTTPRKTTGSYHFAPSVTSQPMGTPRTILVLKLKPMAGSRSKAPGTAPTCPGH